jgi:hypothetical protein
MTAMADAALDLDQYPPPSVRRAQSTSLPWILAAGAGMLAALLAGVLLARPHTVDAPRLVFSISVDQDYDDGAEVERFPDVTAYYQDGSFAVVPEAVTAPWSPSRPIRMLIATGVKSCSIIEGGDLVASAKTDSLGVVTCIWVAP